MINSANLSLAAVALANSMPITEDLLLLEQQRVKSVKCRTTITELVVVSL